MAADPAGVKFEIETQDSGSLSRLQLVDVGDIAPLGAAAPAPAPAAAPAAPALVLCRSRAAGCSAGRTHSFGSRPAGRPDAQVRSNELALSLASTRR